jgi:hypothetical protein
MAERNSTASNRDFSLTMCSNRFSLKTTQPLHLMCVNRVLRRLCLSNQASAAEVRHSGTWKKTRGVHTRTTIGKQRNINSFKGLLRDSIEHLLCRIRGPSHRRSSASGWGCIASLCPANNRKRMRNTVRLYLYPKKYVCNFYSIITESSN